MLMSRVTVVIVVFSCATVSVAAIGIGAPGVRKGRWNRKQKQKKDERREKSFHTNISFLYLKSLEGN